MSDKPYEAVEKAVAKTDAPPEKVEASYERLSYGLHTLPKKFWVVGSKLLDDPAFIKRRAAKNARHLENKATKAEQNRRGHR